MLTRLRSLLMTDLRPNRSDESDASNSRWATESLVGSIRQVVISTAGVWQVVMAAATVTTLGVDGLALACAQLVLGAVSWWSLRNTLHASIVPLSMMGLALWGYLVSGRIDSTLAFAACWQINFASCIAALTLMSRAVFGLMLGAAAAVSVAMMAWLPDWGLQLPVSIVVTQFSIVMAMRLGLPALITLSREVDAATDAAERAEAATEVTRRASAAIAEEARVLHDTAINTLGAIANGTAGLADAERVRDQCARDIRLLEVLRGSEAVPETLGLTDLFALPGLPIERRGIDDAGLLVLEAEIGSGRCGAIVGCVREALTNAAKHSHAAHVVVETRLQSTTDGGASLIVEVLDDGVGFSRLGLERDASASDTRVRGIAGSIEARALEAGFSAAIDSQPGRGTRVRLTVPIVADGSAAAGLTAAVHADDTGIDIAPVAELTRRAASYWALGASGVSVVLTVGGGTNVGALLIPMIALMLTCWWVMRQRGLRGGRVARAALLVASGMVFVLAAGATGFGTVDPVHWQALAATAPVVLCLATGPSRRTMIVAGAAAAILVVVVALVMLPVDPVASKITAVAGIVWLGFSIVWSAFQSLVVARGEQAAIARRRVFAARLQRELEIAAQSSYRRWLAAGLDEAVVLLKQLAAGRDPHEEATRRLCTDEERYLRQLLQISPDLVHLGSGLMASLSRARRRGVDVEFRIGEVDAPDESTARRIVTALERSIALTPHDGRLLATLFPVHSGLRLTLLGPHLDGAAPDSADARFERLGSVDLLELTYTGDQRLVESRIADERRADYRGAR